MGRRALNGRLKAFVQRRRRRDHDLLPLHHRLARDSRRQLARQVVQSVGLPDQARPAPGAQQQPQPGSAAARWPLAHHGVYLGQKPPYLSVQNAHLLFQLLLSMGDNASSVKDDMSEFLQKPTAKGNTGDRLLIKLGRQFAPQNRLLLALPHRPILQNEVNRPSPPAGHGFRQASQAIDRLGRLPGIWHGPRRNVVGCNRSLQSRRQRRRQETVRAEPGIGPLDDGRRPVGIDRRQPLIEYPVPPRLGQSVGNRLRLPQPAGQSHRG